MGSGDPSLDRAPVVLGPWEGRRYPKGSFVLVPGGVTHDFQNRGPTRAGVLNLSIPGEFERHMPGIVQWFIEHPPGVTDG